MPYEVVEESFGIIDAVENETNFTLLHDTLLRCYSFECHHFGSFHLLSCHPTARRQEGR